jgi:parvulin-like peptidyl-prolyl isomerase
VITAKDYRAALREGMRNKFYHGRAPVAALAVFQREVGDKLITRALLVREAERRGIRADDDWVQERLKQAEEKFARRPDWPEPREEAMLNFGERLREESILRQLEQQVREVGTPTEAQVRDYYDANPEKFTEPEQVRLSLILLTVDPSAPASAWDAASAEAEAVVTRLREGADFAELARLHSGDPSSVQGGDMGKVHKGVLGKNVEAAIDAAALGDILDPVRVLEGIAVFRLEQRFAVRLRDYASVRERAMQLWGRDHGEQLWQQLIARLREDTPIHVREEHYLPLAGADSEQS